MNTPSYRDGDKPPAYLTFDDRDPLPDIAKEITRTTGRHIESSRWALFGERLHASLIVYLSERKRLSAPLA